MEIFIGILGIVWGILCTILFFKVWNACNNIEILTNKFAPERMKEIKSSIETREEIDNWIKEK